MTKLGTLLRKRRDEGASAVEYGLLVALIAVVVATAVVVLGTSLRDKFNNVEQCVAASACAEGGSSSE